MNFAHVSDSTLRALLNGQAQWNEDSICQALTLTRECLEADTENPEIPFHVLDARESALDEAEAEWNDEGNLDKSAEALRRFWNV